jgi:hypothetical protein
MTSRKRGALFIAALAASAAALPAPSAPAYERCYAVFSDGGEICFGGSECNGLNERLEKVTGQRWECLQ